MEKATNKKLIHNANQPHTIFRTDLTRNVWLVCIYVEVTHTHTHIYIWQNDSKTLLKGITEYLYKWRDIPPSYNIVKMSAVCKWIYYSLQSQLKSEAIFIGSTNGFYSSYEKENRLEMTIKPYEGGTTEDFFSPGHIKQSNGTINWDYLYTQQFL